MVGCDGATRRDDARDAASGDRGSTTHDAGGDTRDASTPPDSQDAAAPTDASAPGSSADPSDAQSASDAGASTADAGSVTDAQVTDAAIDSGAPPEPPDLTPPRLSHDVVDLAGSYDAPSQTLGALDCATPAGQPSGEVQPCFSPFALGASGEQGLTALGHVALITHAGAEVHAAAAGVVTFVGPLDAADPDGPSRVEVRPSQRSVFTLEYLSLTDVAVEVGDTVDAGARLGDAAPYVDAAFGRVGFGVRREQSLVQRLCPTRYGNAGWVARLEAARAASNLAFPTHTADAVCASASIACEQPPCESGSAFRATGGDVDLGSVIFASECSSCHGAQGQGVSATNLLSCASCATESALSGRIAADMPPEGECLGTCATDVAAFIKLGLQ